MTVEILIEFTLKTVSHRAGWG